MIFSLKESHAQINVMVSQSADDIEENVSTGTNYHGNDLDLGAANIMAGIRFQNITIPEGSLISSAYIEFKAFSAQSAASDLTFYCEDVPDASAFTTSAYALSNRNKTSASVTWSSVSGWSANVSYQSADLSEIIQEVINRDDWETGNAIAFIIEGTGNREAYSYEGSSVNAPILVVDYTCISTFPYSEDFDGGSLCSNTAGTNCNLYSSIWYNDSNDDFDWTASKGDNNASPSGNTGPGEGSNTKAIDQSLGSTSGVFLYTETSTPINTGDEAYVVSGCFDISSLDAPIFSFWYHMYGTAMGDLFLEVLDGNSQWQTIDTLSGEHHNDYASVTGWSERVNRLDDFLSTPTNGEIQLRFRGVCGSGFTSDMAIDDFTLEDFCSGTTDVTVSSPYEEDFNSLTFCSNSPGASCALTGTIWTNESGDDIDWNISSGDDFASPTSATGPGNSSTKAMDGDGDTSGMFLYLESSYAGSPDKVAIMSSSCINIQELGEPYLFFDYHMYGVTMGNLFIEINNGAEWIGIDSIKGSQHSNYAVGDNWTERSIDLKAFKNKPYYGIFKLRFRGVTGSSYTSDMAIDNIRIDGQCLQGTYTVGASAGNDFTSFAEVAENLNAMGICGPVSFNIEAGTYQEQFTLNSITGSSASDTILFQSLTGDSTDVVLTWPAGTGSNHIVELNGTDYITFKSITFDKTGVHDDSRIFYLFDGVHHLRITNCHFDGAIVSGTGLGTSIIFAPNGYTDEQNKFLNNYFNNGGRAIQLYGNSSNYESGNIVSGNYIEGYKSTGIALYYQDELRVENNYVTSSVYAARGIYILNASGENLINGNEVYIDDYSFPYTLYYVVSTSGQETIFKNNICHQGGSVGAQGLSFMGNEYVLVYNNSFSITNSSSGGRCVYISGVNANFKFVNNIFANTGGGYCIFSNDSFPSITSDYNVLYFTGSNIGHYNGNVISSFSDWKNATGFDANSINQNPEFVSSTDLHLASNSPCIDAGTGLASILYDFEGDPRDANLDIGADEEFTGIVLGTELDIFYLQKADSGIKIFWKNFDEHSLAHYELEWFSEGPGNSLGFKVIHRQLQDSEKEGKYSYLHKNFSNGWQYYRIKSLFDDGSIHYSDVQKILLNPAAIFLNVYPNPAKDAILVSGEITPNSPYHITLHDAVGRPILTREVISATSEFQDYLELGFLQLANGIYYIRMSGQKENQILPLIIAN